MGSANMILFGLVTIYRKTYSSGAAEPVVSNVLTTSTFTQLGYQSEDGLTETLEFEHVDINVPEANGTVESVLVNESATISVALQERQLSEMVHSMPGATYTAGAVDGTNENELTVGGKAAADSCDALLFVGEDRGGIQKAIYYPKVIKQGPGGLQYSKRGISLVTYNWKALIDLTRDAGERLRMEWEITEA